MGWMKYIRDFNNKSPKLKKKFNWRRLFNWVLRIFAVGIAILAILFIYYAKDLPDPNKLLSVQIPQSTKIYARDGSLLYEVHGEYKRTLIPFSDMNDNIKHATIAIEDKNFYNEGGIDLKGMLRAAIVDIFHAHLSQGGSTITQEFVRNAILTRTKSISRKIKEVILSIEINQKFSKNDILKMYLNEIPYGRNAYGIEAAAQTYFGIHAKDLDLAQAAYLAALPQAPSYYGLHRQELDDRKNIVLQQMLNQGYITQAQYSQAKSENVVFQKTSDLLKAPHFVMYIEDYLANKYGEQTLETGGLQVYTTLDPRLQSIAEKAVKDGAERNAKIYNGNNAALVAIDPKTGQILAMVGSKDYFANPTPTGCKPGVNCTFEPDVNVATSLRQPGSSAKPYVYATAFKQQFGFSPASLFFDVVTDFGKFGGQDYIPHDYDMRERGPVSLRQALAGSLNIPSVKLLDLVGVNNAVQTMHDFGITAPLQNCGLSLVLGGCEVTLLDHVSGYATLASEGVHHPETGILKILDSTGNVLEQYQDHPQTVLDPQAAYEIISILTDNNARAFIFGAHSPLYLPDHTTAAKTGTTQNYRDGWTLGFTPSLAAGVWVGNNDGSLLRQGADGVVVAGPIWHNFMEQALQGTPDEQFPVPQGIQNVTVDTVSGLLPNPYTPTTKQEVFASYSVPTQYDNVHVVVKIDKTTGLPPTQFSNPADIVTKMYTVFHSRKPDNANWEGPVEAWAIAHGYQYPPPGAVLENGEGGSSVSSGGPGSNSGNNTGTSSNNSPTGGTSGGTPNETPGQTINVGNPPTVSILSPTDGSTVSSMPITIQASAVPDAGNQITRVDLLVDGTFIQSVSSAPYTFTYNNTLSPGAHVFAIHAVDDKNNTADTSITLNIQ